MPWVTKSVRYPYKSVRIGLHFMLTLIYINRLLDADNEIITLSLQF